MDFDTVRPIISGLVGAAIAGWLATKWARRLPLASSPIQQQRMVGRQKKVIRCANVGAGIGIGTGLVLYLGGFLDSHDWRGLGLSAGLTALFPLLIIVMGNIRAGADEIWAGFAAYAVAQKTPAVLLFPLMGLMIAGGIWATVALFPQADPAEQGSEGNSAAFPVSP